jgi:hypothetical protein
MAEKAGYLVNYACHPLELVVGRKLFIFGWLLVMLPYDTVLLFRYGIFTMPSSGMAQIL